MLADDTIRDTLLGAGLATAEAVRRLEALATKQGASLYRTAIEAGHVAERDIVSALAASFGVASVSLERFTGKAELFAILPPPVVKRHRALPVGLREEGGQTWLFIAMDDPHDLDALEAVSQCCTYGISPVLAGPVDLERAIERIYAPPSEPLRIEHTAPSYRKSQENLLGELIGDFGVAPSPRSASALSMLDDIPRSRHDDVTPVSGIGFELPDLGGSRSVSGVPVLDTRESTDQGRVVRSPSQSGFQRSGRSAVSGWRARRSDELVNALVTLLLRKGIITEDELIAALEE